MGSAVRAVVTGLGQSGDVATIRLDASAAVFVHWSIVRIGDDDFVSELLEVLGDPFTLRRSLYENAHGRSTPEDVCQSFACRRDAPVDDLAARHHYPNLTFFLVQVDGTILHGWSPLLRLERVFAMWSGSYHVTKEASRFILS
jgi:hypothetical protein